MLEGRVLAARFELSSSVASGAMATIHRALDRTSGEQVAVKVLRGRAPDQMVRFEREAEVLASLKHPAIVRFLSHGVDDGDCYLAMQWLEGEDLGQRLARSELTIAESIACIRRVAAAAGFAHERGVIHRDIKPTNIFLAEGKLDLAMLVDFGLARLVMPLVDFSASGMLIGTPAFMSPEQARGSSKLDPSSDVFALGSVLYRCLSGEKPFRATDTLGLLAEILLEDPPPPSRFRPEVSAALDALVLRMLAKEPEDRPSDGAAVVRELERLDPSDPARPSDRPPAISTGERRLFCALLVRTEWREDDLRDVAASHGGHLEWLGRDVVVMTITGTSAATDLATRAARAALAVRALLPASAIAMVTGRGMIGAASVPVGEVVDRGVRLLRLRHDRADAAERVRIDEVTAGLLDARFEVSGDDEGLFLLGMREVMQSTRTLLGKETPCVGRDAELAVLDALFSASREEPSARAVVVMAPAGMGKSRVRYEFLRRVLARDEGAAVWIGRGDPMTAGSPFGMLSEAVLQGIGMPSGDPLPLRQKKLRARVGRHVAEQDAARVARFVGEMVGTPFVDDDLQLRAAREDPMLMGDQMRRALEDWVAAECAAHPLIVVLEDLHWGDQPTVSFVDSLLRNLKDSPLFVLALARPELEATFPALWAARDCHVMRLKELPVRAGERLVRAVLGEVDTTIVERIVERAAGNAFFLEELVRGVAEGNEQTLPDTVLAMLHARIDALAPVLRHVLRAASVFGERFSEDGVRALLSNHSAAGVPAAIEALVVREILVRTNGQKLTFRHALVRDAAYDALPEDDRRNGHRLAARFLEKAGDPDAIAMAEHFERGAEPSRAIRWYRVAAEQAVGGNDLVAALARVTRGLACLADETATVEVGALFLVKAEAHNWRGEFAAAEEAALRALAGPASPEVLCAAIGEVALASGVQGHKDTLRELADRIGNLAEAEARAFVAASRLAEQLIITGESERAALLLSQLEANRARVEACGPAVSARLASALGLSACFRGAAAEHLRLIQESIAAFESAGDLRNACVKREREGYVRMDLGEYARAEKCLREALASAEKMGLANVAATARHNLGLTLARLGRCDEGEACEAAAAEAFAAAGNRRMEGASYEYLALIRLEGSRVAAARDAAITALRIAEAEPVLPLNRAESLAILARVELASGRPHEAMDLAEGALSQLERLGGIDDGEALIRLVYAEALDACGRKDEARSAALAAKARLVARAAKVDEALRATFLTAIPENARTLALAEALAR